MVSNTDNEKLISIGKAAEMLGVSIKTLRRWDESGKFHSLRMSKSGNRLYRMQDIQKHKHDLYGMAFNWIKDTEARTPDDQYYCQTSDIFKARLHRMEIELKNTSGLQEIYSLITAISGEIGNNSFDHNLGQWPDVVGIFFAYDTNKKYVVLGDRGQGVLTTLKRVKTELKNDTEAIGTAFTERISGRAPEHRGNGLKFVKNVVTQSNVIKLTFLSGDATLMLKKNDLDPNITTSEIVLRGCLALIAF